MIPRLPNAPREFEKEWATQLIRILELENQSLWAAIQQLRLYELPQYTTAEKNLLTGLRVGRMIFDTDLDKACVYTSGGWETITST